jgi:hypothetical protein
MNIPAQVYVFVVISHCLHTMKKSAAVARTIKQVNHTRCLSHSEKLDNSYGMRLIFL